MDSFALAMMRAPLFEVDNPIDASESSHHGNMARTDLVGAGEANMSIEECFARSRERSQQSRTLFLNLLQQEQAETQTAVPKPSADRQAGRQISSRRALNGPLPSNLPLKPSLHNTNTLRLGISQVKMQLERSSASSQRTPSSLYVSPDVMMNTSINGMRDSFKKALTTLEPSTSSNIGRDDISYQKGINSTKALWRRESLLSESDCIYRNESRHVPSTSGATRVDEELFVPKPSKSINTKHRPSMLNTDILTDISSSEGAAVSTLQSREKVTNETTKVTDSRKRCISEVDFSSPSTVTISPSPSDETFVGSSTKTLARSRSPLLLHHACKKHADLLSIVQNVLKSDPDSASRRLPQSSTKRSKPECDLPINIAIQSNASLPVMELLAKAAPHVLVEGDGTESCCSLSLALYKRREIDVIAMLMNANQEQAYMQDRHKNYPLHVACSSGAPLPVVELLASSYRPALWRKNFHGMTPLDIARRNTFCSDEVLQYLEEAMFGLLEQNSAAYLDNNLESDDAETLYENCSECGDESGVDEMDYVDEAGYIYNSL